MRKSSVRAAILAGVLLAFAGTSSGTLAQSGLISGQVMKIDVSAGKITLKHGPIK
jgi:Cu(I)/Ag(I) efflux system protein CusF